MVTLSKYIRNKKKKKKKSRNCKSEGHKAKFCSTRRYQETGQEDRADILLSRRQLDTDSTHYVSNKYNNDNDGDVSIIDNTVCADNANEVDFTLDVTFRSGASDNINFNSIGNNDNEMPNDIDLNCRDNPISDDFTCSLKMQRHRNLGNLIFAYINVNSIKHKFEYFVSILQDGYIDVLCIAETKLDHS